MLTAQESEKERERGNKVSFIQLLKEKLDVKNVAIAQETVQLKLEISELEKQRRQLHTLLLELHYCVDEDCKYACSRIASEVTSIEQIKRDLESMRIGASHGINATGNGSRINEYGLEDKSFVTSLMDLGFDGTFII